MGYNEIRTNADGTLDEVCLENVGAHLEQMSERTWWLGLSRGGKTLHVWFNLDKGKLDVYIAEDELGLPVVVTDSL